MEDNQSLMKALFDAVNESDLTALRDIAARAPHMLDAGWLGGDTQSYLHLAAQNGRFEVCKALVELGIDVNRRDPSGGDDVALGVAASRGHADICRWLLDQGALVDGLPTTVSTPLMGASVDGHVEIAEILLDHGAEINREHLKFPETALDNAIAFSVKGTGQDAVAALLRERGGIRPYTEKHEWRTTDGWRYIEHVERAVEVFVNPLPVLGEAIAGRIVHRVRLPKRYDYQFVFVTPQEDETWTTALCLPSAWPLHDSCRDLDQYNWPVRLLAEIANLTDPETTEETRAEVLAIMPEAYREMRWLYVELATFEAEREADDRIAKTRLLVPYTKKKAFKSEQDAATEAAKMAGYEWKKLALPILA